MKSERPGLPVAFSCSLAFWAAGAMGYATGAERTVEANASWALAAFAAAAAFAMLLSWRRARLFAFVGIAAAVGLALGCAQASNVLALSGSYGEAGLATFTVELLEDSRAGIGGESALVRGSAPGYPEAVFSARIASDAPLLCGQRLVCSARPSPIDLAADGYAWRSGASARLAVESWKEEPSAFPLGPLRAIRMRAIEAFDEGEGGSGVLPAIVCGYRRSVTGTEAYEQFQACGLAHLVAVSGAHLVIVTGLFASVLKWLRVPRRLAVALLVCAMAAYFVIAGMPVSALRATIMSSLGLLSFFGRRRASSLNSIGIGVFAIVASDPTASVSASFTLSALATAGIVIFGPLFQSWLARTPLACVPAAVDSVALTLAASVLSQLYACSLFGQLPLVAPLANLLCAPLFPFICASGLVAALTVPALPQLGFLALSGARLASGLLAAAVGAIASVPYASVPFSIETTTALVASALLGVLLWVAWPRKPSHVAAAFLGPALAVVLVSAGGMLFEPPDRIVMLDVGQGDAILVQSRGQALLIDTGNHDAELLRELAKCHVVHLDGVLVTHADDDHCGSLDALRQAVQVDRVIVASGIGACEDASAKKLMAEARLTAGEVVELALGGRFHIGAFSARAVWPREVTEGGGNADSLCLLLEYDGDEDGAVDCRALMTGDAEKEQLAQMLESGSVGRVDILKVGHHGSRNGMTAEEARVLSPRIALISCGLNNRYGHPTQEILDLLDEAGASTYRTDLDGTVTCALDPQHVKVSAA